MKGTPEKLRVHNIRYGRFYWDDLEISERRDGDGDNIIWLYGYVVLYG